MKPPAAQIVRLILILALGLSAVNSTPARAASASADYSILYSALPAGGDRAASADYAANASLGDFGGSIQSPDASYLIWLGNIGQFDLPPTLVGLTNLTANGGSAPVLSFTVSDLESAPSALTVSVSGSSDPILIPLGNVALSGTGAVRTLQLRAAPGRTGSSVINVRVVNEANLATTASFTVSVTVAAPQLLPTVTWAALPALTYGAALSSAQLNAAASVPGGFAYTPAAGAVLSAGLRQTLLVTFTPADTTTYGVVTATNLVDVRPAGLTITADNKVNRQGQSLPALTASYNGFVNGDAVASLTQAPTLATSATSASPSGTYPITVGGAASGNYAISYVNGTLTVTTKLLPTLTWATPSAIIYGAALSGAQLDATSSVPGVFTYAPPVGAVLSAGLGQTLSATFTPTDGATYENVSTTVRIDVGRAPLTITAQSKSKSYGAALPSLTAAYSGFVNGEDTNSLNAPAVLGTPATAASSVGTYAVTAQGAASANYSISYVAGTLTVTTAPLVITADNKSQVLGAALPALTASYAGFVNGDGVASLTTPAFLTTTANGSSGVGSYPIQVSGATDANYAITFVPGVLNILATNPPPTLNPISDRGVGADQLEQVVRLTGIASGAGNAAQNLTVSASVTPTNVIALDGIGSLNGKGEADLSFHALPNVQLGQSATVTVTVSDGGSQNSTTSRSFLVTVTDLRLSAIGGQSLPGLFLDVPIVLNSSAGGQQSLAFSLSFNPGLFSFQQALPGADATNASVVLNVQQATNGLVGVSITPAANAALTAGTRELVKLRFLAPDDAPAGSGNLLFVDAPVPLRILDSTGSPAPCNFVSGVASVTLGLEAGVSPRPTGPSNGAISVKDWVQVGRFAASLDSPQTANEFRRADCAPRAALDGSLLLGDGRLSIADWVQAGRYAAALDPVTPCGGPAALSAALASVSASARAALQPLGVTGQRVVRVNPVLTPSGTSSWASVEMECAGTENALGFSLRFDERVIRVGQVRLAAAAQAATLLVNRSAVEAGWVGIALALPPGQALSAGRRVLVELAVESRTTEVNSNASLMFADWPIVREACDVMARTLPVAFQPGAAAFEVSVETGAVGALRPSLSIGGVGSGDTLQMRLFGNPGSSYVVESSTDLAQWETLEILTLDSSSADFLAAGISRNTARFYRLRQTAEGAANSQKLEGQIGEANARSTHR